MQPMDDKTSDDTGKDVPGGVTTTVEGQRYRRRKNRSRPTAARKLAARYREEQRRSDHFCSLRTTYFSLRHQSGLAAARHFIKNELGHNATELDFGFDQEFATIEEFLDFLDYDYKSGYQGPLAYRMAFDPMLQHEANRLIKSETYWHTEIIKDLRKSTSEIDRQFADKLEQLYKTGGA